MNRVIINFIPCTPTPPKGYRIYWRVAGAGPLNYLGNFFGSPIAFLDDSPYPTAYEGVIVAEYNTKSCDPVHWSTVGGGGSGGSGSGGISGYPIEVLLAITDSGICTASPQTVYVSSPMPVIAPGVILYQDAALTIPITGYLFVAEVPAGVNYNLDISTGEVLTLTGTAC